VKPLAVALVGLGGAVGAIARFLVGNAVASLVGFGWPWGTFVINVSGCFFIGLFLTLTTERFAVNEAWRYLVPIGFIGGYTTFSTYEYETLRLIEQGAAVRAASYELASTGAGLFAVWAASWLARQF
jgi:CrcB protein